MGGVSDVNRLQNDDGSLTSESQDIYCGCLVTADETYTVLGMLSRSRVCCDFGPAPTQIRTG